MSINKLMAVLLLTITIAAKAQTNLPATLIRDNNGKNVSFKTLIPASDTAIVVNFWATWCIPCITELGALNDQYRDWQKVVPFKLITISVDDLRTAAKVRPFLAGRGWQFTNYLDTNNDLKRSLNINDIPHVLIIKNGKIVYQHTGYLPGNEDELFEKLKQLKPL